MATLKELYDYLETKKDDEHLNNVFSFSDFSPEEWPKARLEILTWWKIESIVEDENCVIDRDEAVEYFAERIKKTDNLWLKYRYGYFAYLLSNNNQYARRALDALIDVIEELMPEDKDDYPHNADDAIEVLMALSQRIKYRKDDVKLLLWRILESDFGYRTKLVCIRKATNADFFDASEAEKVAIICKELLPLTKDGWCEGCCEVGLFYASKLQSAGKPYKIFFYEFLGDMEMERLKDPSTEPNNIAIPHMNEVHLEKAMAFYQEAGLNKKRNAAEKAFRENKKKLIYLHYNFQKKTDKQVVQYFESLKKELVEGKLSWLLLNLAMPIRFMFPSYQKIQELMPEKETTFEDLGIANKLKDINGNTKNADKDFESRQKYEVWLLNIVSNVVLNVILTAIQTKQLSYAKLKHCLLKGTCFGTPFEYARSNQVVVASWFSQIDYGLKALIMQYQRFLQGKTTDWRIPIDILSVRFEGILRDMVGEYGGHVTKIGRDYSTSQVLLDALLKEAYEQKVFAVEDIEFFEYVFTPKGRNIRNNVAHAFYIPQDYKIIEATLVFLCILRLTTFRPKNLENEHKGNKE
jgi:hypothetical protein